MNEITFNCNLSNSYLNTYNNVLDRAMNSVFIWMVFSAQKFKQKAKPNWKVMLRVALNITQQIHDIM